MRPSRPTAGLIASAGAGALCASLYAGDAHAADDLLIEVHYKPVPNVQLAIWLEDKSGKFVQDILVTQATGKLGIGNRPGLWNFLSSWRAPYGPRPSVLPVWAHRRGKTYPKVVFHDDDPGDKESLGWHENTSSPETYFCVPLTAAEHEAVVDVMTCPSPAVFQTDKGAFDPRATSPYPPRNDLIEFEEGDDSPDAMTYAARNDLDAVTAATPPGDKPEYIIATIPAASAGNGPITAYIEVSLEHDENASHDYDREKDHFVDPRLEPYGIEYLGQPSVVYKVDFNPRTRGFRGSSTYTGYGDWNGATGTLHPPDATISASKGSGADRLQQYSLNGETFRFGVFAYGDDSGDDPDDTSDTGTSDTGSDSDGGWGNCKIGPLAPVTDLTLTGISFDKVEVGYTLPPQSDPDFAVSQLSVHLLSGDTPLTEDMLGAAQLAHFTVREPGDLGRPTTLEVDQLWGNFTYQIGITYKDKCGNRSALVAAPITTAAQKFQQVEGFCFLATAAYGAAWVSQVQALRWFRDAYLKSSPIGRDLVRFYYSYSPPLARVVQHQPLLRGMVRVVIQPLADMARLSTRG